MKRLNETTNMPFKSGEARADGKLFYGYTKRLLKNGFFVELWLTPETYHENKAAKRAKQIAKRDAKLIKDVEVAEAV